MTPDDPFDIALLNLQLSDVRRLDAVRRSSDIPYGTRLVQGGVGIDAAGAVNSRLNDQCTTRAGGVEVDLVERAWLTRAQQGEAARYREAQQEFQRRGVGEGGRDG